ncbi:MAG TPA: glycerol-3-phosphate 1-O-acyltransferase [Streptosporangiaceae bacterium]|jgi:glycerol-3-phosphate O-acyltransferase|nr:glycerol-3-phosphate 1-O-acyltransferase [Streptosporangiaceae bacterium]
MDGRRPAHGAAGHGLPDTGGQPGAEGTDSADGVGAPVILLADANSDVERALVKRWLSDAELRPSAVLPLDSQGLARSLDEMPPDTMVTAARVAWLPRQRDGEAPTGGLGLLPMINPRHPPTLWQARIARREPDRAKVVLAEPATVAALRARWGGTGSFAHFVSLQARLALERAERPLRGYRYKVPRHVVEAIQDSPQFRGEVTALAAKLKMAEAEAMDLAETGLEGLVASMSPLAVDVLSGALRPLHARAWEVQADTAGLERLRELNRSHALVFLPSHRSYADSLLLADVLADNDFPRNHVLGGDNLSFWPIGPLAKRAGVVFIRRSFGGDEIYKLALREYLGYLLAKRFNLEWYMEGGRSRTGKLRPPRYGLLTYLVEAIERGYADDAYMVPVSITYDQLREASAMAVEQGGGTKRAEGLSWLASYARGQLNRIGTVHVRFAEPFSLREAMAVGQDLGDQDRADQDPVDRDAWRLRLQKVAFEVAVRINRVTPATATALVTLALLGVRDRALTLRQVRQVLEPLRAYLMERGLPYSGEALRTEAGVRRVLAALAQQHVVTIYDGGEEPVYAIEQGQHLVAAFYRNSAIHHFVDRAVAELVLLSAPADRWDEAMKLRDQLKFEFFFPDKESYRTQLSAELDRLDPRWESVAGRAVLERSPLLMAHRVLRSFLDAQLVVAERLAARGPARSVEDKEFLDECSGVGRQMLLQGRLHGPESLSRELFSSALKLADNLNLTGSAVKGEGEAGGEPAGDETASHGAGEAGEGTLTERRQAFATRLRDLVARVITIDEIDAASRREAVGVEP